MMNKIDWKDIFKSWMTVALHYIEVVIFWFLFAWTTFLFLLIYANDFQDVGIALGVGLFVAAITCWVVASTITIKVYDIIIRRGE